MADKRDITVYDDYGQKVGEGKITEGKDGYYLSNVKVDEDKRGKGYGRKIAEEADHIADGRPIKLEVDSSNAIAILFWSICGFRETERVTSKNGKTYIKMRKG